MIFSIRLNLPTGAITSSFWSCWLIMALGPTPAGGSKKLPIRIPPIWEAISSFVGMSLKSGGIEIDLIINLLFASTSLMTWLAFVSSGRRPVIENISSLRIWTSTFIPVKSRYFFVCSADICFRLKTLYLGGSGSGFSAEVRSFAILLSPSKKSVKKAMITTTIFIKNKL